jgi:hypothetical protein
VPRTNGADDVGDRSQGSVLHRRWRRALRSRSTGRGCKPPQAASVKSRGGERCGNGGQPVRQVGVEKASESEPLMTCRKPMDGIETGGCVCLRDEPGGYLSTAQAVPGMEVARARLRLWCGTWEPVAPIAMRPFTRARTATRSSRGRTPRGRNPERQSTDAGHRGGPACSSDEGPVMGLEPRGRIISDSLMVNHEDVG